MNLNLLNINMSIIIRVFILFFLSQYPKLSMAQNFFKLTGNAINLEEDFLTCTIYKNWVETPSEFKLKLDKKKNFSLELPLTETAYIDIDFGFKGIYLWIIEPNDVINIQVDCKDFDKSLNFSGSGSSKWNYLKEQQKYFEKDKDWDLELEKLKKITKKAYFELTNYLLNEQIAILNKFKTQVSDEFYSLQRADIYGKMSNYNLKYLVAQKMFNQTEFERFELKTFNPKIQNKSFEVGQFIEALIDNHNMLAKKHSTSILIEYESVKSYYEKYDLVDKQMIDRILAIKIVNYLDAFGINEETKLLVASYKEFSKNKVYTNAVISKFRVLQDLVPGKEAKNFIFPDIKGNMISLKDFRGKNIFLGFYATWCGPCLNDLTNLEIVFNYFIKDNDLQFVFVSIDTPKDFEDFIKANRIFGTHLNSNENTNIVNNYAIEGVPNYFLIDKSGTIISEHVIGPNEDEGRALIKQIEQLVYKK